MVGTLARPINVRHELDLDAPSGLPELDLDEFAELEAAMQAVLLAERDA